ncbi:MAG: PQQ-dependent sugar dehydrogenase [Chloroflexia bacterium]
MKVRLFPAIMLLAVAALAACGPSTSEPTPTSTVEQAAPTATTQAVPATPPDGASGAPTATPQATAPEQPAANPTATQPAQAERPALTLQPVTVETTDATRKGVFADERAINLPPGFHVKVYAIVPGARWLGLSPQGTIYATSPGAGRVYTLPGDGTARTFADGLDGVHGIAFKDNAVYVATQGQIIRLEDTNKDGVADKRDVLARDLPTGGGHSTRTIAFGPDGKLYVSAGSSCNVCNETDPKRAAISRYSADGKFEKVYARGLRNAVGILFHPITGDLWATVNGRDGLGDDVPPETIYNIKEDTDYGWPFCYGDRVPDPTMEVPEGYCEKTGTPAVKMQAHSAPLGLAFYTGDKFPAEFRGDMFVAFHGSWNRSVPTGYKLVRIRFKDNQPDPSAGKFLVEDFATGWSTNGDVWGRPVDPMVAPDGSLLLTDDKAGVVYSIYYQENAGP